MQCHHTFSHLNELAWQAYQDTYLPSGENVLTPRSYSLLVRNMTPPFLVYFVNLSNTLQFPVSPVYEYVFLRRSCARSFTLNNTPCLPALFPSLSLAFPCFPLLSYSPFSSAPFLAATFLLHTVLITTTTSTIRVLS